MSKKKQEQLIEINRNQYNQMKKLDHHGMELCIGKYYEQGFQAGKKVGGQDVKGPFNMELALSLISGIRGIGDKKLEEIRQSLLEAGAEEITGIRKEG